MPASSRKTVDFFPFIFKAQRKQRENVPQNEILMKVELAQTI